MPVARFDLLQSRFHADSDRLNGNKAEMPLVGSESHLKAFLTPTSPVALSASPANEKVAIRCLSELERSLSQPKASMRTW